MSTVTTPENLRSLNDTREVSYIDYYIENGDTLLYSINYKNNKGYMIVGGDNSTFPIISFSNEGNLRFDSITADNPLKDVLAFYKEQIKKSLYNPDGVNGEYYEKWKDLGKEGYQYSISLSNGEPLPGDDLRATRKESSGKKTIYPYTGKELDSWNQAGSFNSYAPRQACIGCPAVAIGMLLYDVSNRMTGLHADTNPSFPYYASQATEDNEAGKMVSKVLKQIADSIPNYHWGSATGQMSGATPEDILVGLKKLGFKKAKLEPYNFETLYKNLTFRRTIYGSSEVDVNRGVLIGANELDSPAGHIWFCDGYFEQAFTVTKKFWFIKIKSWTEYDDRLFMNWGWGTGSGSGDGWYTASDDLWNSLDHKSSKLKRNPRMFTGLDYYSPSAVH